MLGIHALPNGFSVHDELAYGIPSQNEVALKE